LSQQKSNLNSEELIGTKAQTHRIALACMSDGSALRQGFGLAADEFVAVLFLGFADVVEVLLRIVTEFLFDLVPDAPYLFYDGVLHITFPSTLRPCRAQP
jgi:hypothetical protein